MPHVIFIIFFFALGACIGSFLNVVVWRLPRGESLVTPPSRCPICEHRLAWYDNIPVFGWLMIRGRCRYCRTSISAQYPTIEFITGALFVFYYVMYFIVPDLGPCWVQEVRDPYDLTIRYRHIYVENIQQHWPQYLLAVFTVSALLAASLIDAKQFWIPQSIPVVMAAIGLLYHTILDRPLEPGALTVGAPAGALALGAGIGLIVSLSLLWWGKMPRSFAEGWPALEIDSDPSPAEEPEGKIAKAVRGWIDAFRPKLAPEQQRALSQFKASAAAREKVELAKQKEEEAKQPKIEVKEFTRADISREIRKEMLFLMAPILLGIAAFIYASSGKAGWWTQIVFNHHWLSGLLGSLLGALVGGFVVWLTRILGSLVFGREAMGMGDVDLMFGVGAIVGAGASTVAFFVAPFFGLALAIYMFIVGKRRELPYGPYLSLGTAFVMIYYCPIADYLRPGLTTISEIVRQRFQF
jgi:leader peptidase (prepilin peptidase)/N-methyltransferase